MPRTKNRILEDSPLYKRLMSEEEEIKKHKWYQSEQAHHDVGWDFAMFDWIIKYKPHHLSGISGDYKKSS